MQQKTLNQYAAKNTESKGFIDYITDDDDILYNRGVGLKHLDEPQNSIVAGDWICFQGDGELHVTVQEYDRTGYITHLDKDQNSVQDEVTGNIEYKTLSIDPDHYHYESNADGSFFVVKLDLQNLELDTNYGVHFEEPKGKIRRYKKIEHAESNNRHINYANPNGAAYESSLISGSFSIFYNSLSRTQSIFSGAEDHNKISNISPRVFWGDISHIMEDQATFAPYIAMQLGDHSGDFYVPGTTRLFTPIWRETVNKYLSITEKSGAEGTDTKKGGVLDLLTTNLTYPLNYVLAMGGFQNVSNGVPTDTPTQAAAKATKAVCDNLKQSYDSDNLRIYVIKYRKQNKYKDLLTQSEGTHVYNYLDQCASGTTAPYLYDISTKTELENALTAIAKDINENFAGYTDAKAFNVE